MHALLPPTRLLLALALLAAAGCRPDAAAPESSVDATATAAAEATPQPTRRASTAIDRVVTADGALELPVPPQELAFPGAGTVIEVAVGPGDAVRPGDALASIDPTALDLAVAEAEAALASARDTLAQAEAGGDSAAAAAERDTAEAALARARSGSTVETARLELERAKNALWAQQSQRDATCGQVGKAFTKQVDCDVAQANVQASEQGVRIAEQAYLAAQAAAADELASAESRARSAQAGAARFAGGDAALPRVAARARVRQAEAALAQATANRERATLTAPFTGTVVAVHIAAGVQVAPGSPAVTLAQTDPLRFVTTNLGERNVADVVEGAPATVTLTAFPDRPLAAVVRRVAGSGTTDETGAVVFKAYLDVQPDGLALRAGMTGRVEIEAGGAAGTRQGRAVGAGAPARRRQPTPTVVTNGAWQ